MTRGHPTLFTLRSGQSGLGFYTTRRDAASKTPLALSNLAFNGIPLALVIDELLLLCGHQLRIILRSLSGDIENWTRGDTKTAPPGSHHRPAA